MANTKGESISLYVPKNGEQEHVEIDVENNLYNNERNLNHAIFGSPPKISLVIRKKMDMDVDKFLTEKPDQRGKDTIINFQNSD